MFFYALPYLMLLYTIGVFLLGGALVIAAGAALFTAGRSMLRRAGRRA